MSKVGGHRNFGYGKQMAWAGKQALRARYGQGHHSTVASHAERWQQFVLWCQGEKDIRDARDIDRTDVIDYGRSLTERIARNDLSVSYGQNLVSSVNIVLETLRGDKDLHVRPAKMLGQRSRVRAEAPAGLQTKDVRQCADRLRQEGHPRVASMIEVARAFGLRRKEASMLNARLALGQAKKHGAINVTAGTKGGRGHRVDRWVPVSGSAMGCLVRAADAQGNTRNLIPADSSLRQWFDHAQRVWASVRGDYGLERIHDLRAAYACERYRRLTGSAAPVVAGRRLVSRETDRSARQTIAQELGHGRIEVVSAYVGIAT